MLKLLFLEEGEGIFTIQHPYKPLAVALLNSIVRGIQQDVLTLAIHIVIPKKNESPRDESFITHKLAWVILTSGKATKNLIKRSECSCTHGCPKCCVKLWIDAVGSESRPYVSTLDLKKDCDLFEVQDQTLVERNKTGEKYKSDPRSDTVLFELPPGKIAQFDMLACLGTGREHAKWSSACAPGLWYKAKVKADVKDIEELTQICPRQVFDAKTKTIHSELCNWCGACQKWAKKKKKNVVIEEEGTIYFRLTTKQLTPREAIFATVDSLIERMKKVLQDLKVEYPTDSIDNAQDFNEEEEEENDVVMSPLRCEDD